MRDADRINEQKREAPSNPVSKRLPQSPEPSDLSMSDLSSVGNLSELNSPGKPQPLASSSRTELGGCAASGKSQTVPQASGSAQDSKGTEPFGSKLETASRSCSLMQLGWRAAGGQGGK